MFPIRTAELSDAQALSAFIKKLDAENHYLLYEPNERKNDTSLAKDFIQRILCSNRSALFFAFDNNGHIIGWICGEASPLKRIMHVMKITIAVLKCYHNQSIAQQLVERLAIHAHEVGIRKVEFSVVKDNLASVNLCQKFGCEIEGIRKNSILIHHKFYDEYLFGKCL